MIILETAPFRRIFGGGSDHDSNGAASWRMSVFLNTMENGCRKQLFLPFMAVNLEINGNGAVSSFMPVVFISMGTALSLGVDVCLV